MSFQVHQHQCLSKVVVIPVDERHVHLRVSVQFVDT